MKNQVHNQGELKELSVKIEAKIVDSVKRMAENQGIPVDELVVIALKRYRATHMDLDVPPQKK